jgi:flagellar basal body rod protein FlgB
VQSPDGVFKGGKKGDRKMTDAALFGNRSGTPDFAETLNQVIGAAGPDYPHADAVHIDTKMLHLMENNITYKNTTEKLLQQMTIITHAMGEGGK